MEYKRFAVGGAVMVGLVLGVYFMYFHRAPTEDILAANKARHQQNFMMRKALQGEHPVEDKDANSSDEYYDYEDDDDDVDAYKNLTPEEASAKKWEKFIIDNNHVSIGEIYNSCDDSKARLTVGKVIMLQDKVHGGVTSRSFLNTTLDEEVTTGEMFLECKYNGKELYSNHWELCTVEEGMDTQVIFCPLKVGLHKFIKDLKIPNYLPRGRYESKAWITNQDDKLLGCGYSDFTI